MYTARFAHLASESPLKVGDLVSRGQVIGIMGKSGDSEGNHLHLDLVMGKQPGTYTLANIEKGTPEAGPLRQLLFFVDNELFGIVPEIITYYGDPAYFVERRKVHFGFDLVPVDRFLTHEHFAIHWPRSKLGEVIRVAYDPKGYGHHVHIAFEA